MSKPCWAIECKEFVPSDSANFPGERHNLWRTSLRFLKRRLVFGITGQQRLMMHQFPSTTRRVLWINQTAPSLGDALMDTAGRILLSSFEVTLLTDKKNADLFRADPIFRNTFTNWTEAKHQHDERPYDLIILDSFSPRSLRLKLRVAPNVPLVGMYGYLNAFEVHRSIFSFRRLETLLDLPANTVRLTHGLTPIRPNVRAENPLVIVGVGGEWSFRIYPDWSEVISGLLDRGFSVVLLGSQNGVHQAQVLTSKHIGLINLVGQTSLSEACGVLEEAKAYIGADGGLWHLASACNVPSVSLHADCHLYNASGDWVSRAPDVPLCIPLRADREVAEISSWQILNAFDLLLSKLRS